MTQKTMNRVTAGAAVLWALCACVVIYLVAHGYPVL